MNSMSPAILRTAALQGALLESVNFSSITTDHQGIIQIFSKGAESMIGYTSAEVVNKIHLADLIDIEPLGDKSVCWPDSACGICREVSTQKRVFRSIQW